jgi:hypothetical protein
MLREIIGCEGIAIRGGVIAAKIKTAWRPARSFMRRIYKMRDRTFSILYGAQRHMGLVIDRTQCGSPYPVWIVCMSRRAFEEEADRCDPVLSFRGELDSAAERPLEGLPAPRVILFETGQALAAALATGVFLCVFLQWIGVR